MRTVSFKTYALAGIIGFLIGLRLLGPALGLLYIFGGAVCVYFAFKNDVRRVLITLVYVVYTEIFIRKGGGVTFVPYLFVQYLMIAVFFIMLIRKGGQLKIHSRCTLFIFLYTVIEILDMIRAQDITYARSMLTNTIVLLFVSLWASANVITPQMMDSVVKHIKIATIYLCGNILVAHFTHEITYSATSSSEASNWMSAVQLSGYMGVGCSMFFLSVMDEKEKDKLVVNVALFALSVTLMVLTFSRGGLYFLSAVIILYVLFNRKYVGRFLILFLLLPVGYIVYYYVTATTGGLIEQRFGEEGASGREDLVKAGLKIFMQEPLAGVGTGNFNTQITERGLFSAESGAHNEFVRAAAEHGIMGIIFYWGFYIVIFIELLNRKKEEREMAFYLLIIYCLIIVHNGLKISVQPYILALIIATPSLVRVYKKKNASSLSHLPSATS